MKSVDLDLTSSYEEAVRQVERLHGKLNSTGDPKERSQVMSELRAAERTVEFTRLKIEQAARAI